MTSAFSVRPSFCEDRTDEDQKHNKEECGHANEPTPALTLYVYWMS